jgi:hypothetical protein
MEQPNPLIEFVKALARRQAKIDARPPMPSNDDNKPTAKDKRAK